MNLDRLKFWKKKEFSPPEYSGKLICKNHYLEVAKLGQKNDRVVEIHALGCEFCTEEKRFNPAIGLVTVDRVECGVSGVNSQTST
ncbi:MAG: hypothetical protein HZC29_04240 [Thaumarchaeota archaeon]|nr:hypothetical protein [Nitrososphaerota archaeon]